jgi:uncharacterized protein YpiB (UPF0302 family)
LLEHVIKIFTILLLVSEIVLSSVLMIAEDSWNFRHFSFSDCRRQVSQAREWVVDLKANELKDVFYKIHFTKKADGLSHL